MLTSSSTSGYCSQYLQPDYFRSPSPTAESKPSPLTLLAQTCNSIGRDSTSTASGQGGKTKSTAADDARSPAGGTSTTRAGDSPSESGRRSSSRGQPHTDDDSPADGDDTASKRLPSSPADVRVSADSPSGTLSTEPGSRRSAPSPSRRDKSPPSPPPRYDGKAAASDYALTSSLPGDPDGLYAMQYLAAVTALQRQSAACDAALLPYLAAQHHRLTAAAGHGFPMPPTSATVPAPCGRVMSPLADRFKPCCSDPRCCQCLQLQPSSRTACVGCSQCATHPQSTAASLSSSSSSALLAAGGHGAFAAALSALSRLPPPATGDPPSAATAGLPSVHTCNWLNPGGAYCGRRFSSVDELMQHLHSHCGTAVPAELPPTPLFPSPAAADLHPVATGSIFAPLAVLYGASSSTGSVGLPYPPQALPPPPGGLDFMPSAAGLAGVQLAPSTKSASPPSLLRHHHHPTQQHGLAAAAAAVAAARYHPYRVPATTLLPPSGPAAPYPSSLAAYYGALCGMGPGSNGTVPPVRL